MTASSQWIWVNHSLKLYTTNQLIRFLVTLDFIDGIHISSRQSNALYIYIFISAFKG